MPFRSLRELSIPDMMVQLPQERLVLRLPPAEPVDADLVPIEVHLHSHQPIQPVRVHIETPAQRLHRPHRTGPPHVDDPAPGSRLEIQSPSLREGTPPGGRLDAIGSVATERGHVTPRSPLQVRQRAVLEAGPDLLLPGAVVVLDGVPIATEKKTTIFTGTDVQRVGGAAAGGSGDMDNIILGTSLACAAGVAAAFRADLRALRARERAMRQGAEFSWGPNGHELRVVLPGLRSAEVTAVESGRIEAALLVEPPVLFLLIRFREQTDRVALGLVCSYCWWGSPEERTDPPASEVVRFVLVEGQSGIVRDPNIQLLFGIHQVVSRCHR